MIEPVLVFCTLQSCIVLRALVLACAAAMTMGNGNGSGGGHVECDQMAVLAAMAATMAVEMRLDHGFAWLTA